MEPASRETSANREAGSGKIWTLATLTIWLSLVSALPAAAEKRVALVIGNSAYQNVTRLDNPRNDAMLMVETLGGHLDVHKTIVFLPVSWALARPLDGAGEPQLCPTRSGIAAHYDPSL